MLGAAQRGSSRPRDTARRCYGTVKKVTWVDYTRRIFLTTKIFKRRTTKWWTGFSRKRWTPHALRPQRPLGGEHGGKWPPRTVRAATDGSSPVEGCLAHPKDSPGQGDGLRGEAALGGVSSAPHSSVRHRVTSKCSRRSPGDQRARSGGPTGNPVPAQAPTPHPATEPARWAGSCRLCHVLWCVGCVATVAAPPVPICPTAGTEARPWSGCAEV